MAFLNKGKPRVWRLQCVLLFSCPFNKPLCIHAWDIILLLSPLEFYYDNLLVLSLSLSWWEDNDHSVLDLELIICNLTMLYCKGDSHSP